MAAQSALRGAEATIAGSGPAVPLLPALSESWPPSFGNSEPEEKGRSGDGAKSVK